MRLPTLLFAILSCMCLCGPVRAEDPPAEVNLLLAMQGETTPDFVTWVATGDAKADGPAAHLSGDINKLRALAELILEKPERFTGRDGEASYAFTAWLVEIGKAAHKQNAKDAAACRALSKAWLAHARVGVDLGKTVSPEAWIKAGDLGVAGARLEQKEGALPAAQIHALALLHEGAKADGASVHRLFDRASVLGAKAVAEFPEEEELRRAVADSFKKQAYAQFEKSARRAQAALRGYFDAFGPIARGERYDRGDVYDFNKLITLAREADLNLKEDYISKRGTALAGLLAYELPDTGNWTKGNDEIDQRFDTDQVFRNISFGIYEWDHVYGYKGSVKDCGGDNIKGVATHSYDAKLEWLRKVKKKRKPSRGRFTKRLPVGITYEVQGITKGRNSVRIRAFFVKAVKAERTISILIYESTALEENDAEMQAVYDSFDITKKQR